MSDALARLEQRFVDVARTAADLVDKYGLSDLAPVAEAIGELANVLSMVVGWSEEEKEIPNAFDLLLACHEHFERFGADLPVSSEAEQLHGELTAYLLKVGVLEGDVRRQEVANA